MALFTNPRKKLARDAAQQLIAGHTTLVALWALRHAGVFDAMLRSDAGIKPHDFAARTKLSEEILTALLDYLTRQGLVRRHDGHDLLSPTTHALLEYETGILEHVRAYQPVMQAVEHLLASLKTYGHGVTRKTDSLIAGQVHRYSAEVYPALEHAVLAAGATHLLDLNCGTGELLASLAKASKKIVGVGMSTDGPTTRQANDLIADRSLEKRLIAVSAGLAELCADPRRTFERTGISLQLSEKFDCLLACAAFSELIPQGLDKLRHTLSQLARTFPATTLILAEPCANPRFDHNHYAPEMELLLRLSRHQILPDQQWRDLLASAGLHIQHETPLQTDGISLFTCLTPGHPASPRKDHRPAPRP